MKTCKNCFNFHNKKCESMTAPFNDLSCFMDKSTRIKAQQDIVQYVKNCGTDHSIKQETSLLKKLEAMQ